VGFYGKNRQKNPFSGVIFKYMKKYHFNIKHLTHLKKNDNYVIFGKTVNLFYGWEVTFSRLNKILFDVRVHLPIEP